MSDKIINRVSNSDLITIDLSDYSPSRAILEIDLKDFLFDGIILKEKEFRSQLNKFDFSVFSNKIKSLPFIVVQKLLYLCGLICL